MSGVQNPPTASMTVASGAAGVFPVSFGLYPQEGSRALSVQYDWTARRSYTEDLSQLQARGMETTIQTLYFDNSTVSAYVTLNVAGTVQVLILPPTAQGILPVFFATPTFSISVPATLAGVTRLILLNVPTQAIGTWVA